MRYQLLMLLLLLLCACTPRAQVDYSNDSIRLVNAEWRTDSLDGFYLRRYHFGTGSLFCSAQYICLIEVPAGSERTLAIASDSTLRTVAELAQSVGAKAAVNGSFFNMEKGNPECYLRIAGRELGENTPQATDSLHRKYYQYATLTIDSLHRPHLLVPDSLRTAEFELDAPDVMTAGPMLLWEGREVPQRTDRTFATKRHSRTAIGMRQDGSVLLLVADGYQSQKAEGLSLNELAHIMRWLGCQTAMNLDGGGSSTMYVAGLRHDGIVSHPADNKKWDHSGLRPISSAILLL